MNIEMDVQQAEAVRELVARRLGNLSTELRRTDNARFRQELKDERELLQSLLPLLEPVAAP